MTGLNPARAELLQTFGLDCDVVRGSGAWLFDAGGRRILDFLSQYGALPFGHNPPEVWAALMAVQRDEVPSMIQPLRANLAERLARRLAEVTPGDLGIVTFANSGAETVEAAVKLARVRTGRDGILSTWNGFHGKTLGALSATGRPQYQRDFAAPAPGFDYVPFGDLDALRDRLKADAGRIAAFLCEPIQGEGGVVCPPEGYLDGAIALCREHGVLSIIDEIQTGLGRTGELFVTSSCAEPPDMLLLAKALGGGLMPIGACVVRPDAWDDRFGLLHSSTFANNNLACAAGLATLDRLTADDQALVRGVGENGAYLRGRLEALQAAYPEVIRQVRGRGYLMGVEFHRFDGRGESATMAFASLNGGVTALIASYLLNAQSVLTAPLFNASHVLRLQPPLIAGQADIDRAVDALGEACAILDRHDYHALLRHLIAPSRPRSPEPEPRPRGPTRRAATGSVKGRFAFLIHYTEEQDLCRSDPSFGRFDPREIAEWLAWVRRLGPGLARRIPAFSSPAGAEADGWILSLPMLPGHMRGKGRAAAIAMIRDAAAIALDAGASRLGLGAFTSIVTRGGESVVGNGIPITSGNTLTTVATVQGIESVALRCGLSLERAHVVVIGASGAIGRLGAMMLARRAGRVTLVGNPENPFAAPLLARVADEVCDLLSSPAPENAGALWHDVHDTLRRLPEAARGGKGLADRLARAVPWRDVPAPISCTTDRASALADADIVVVATSSEGALIDPLHLRPGTLVCDVSRPPNVARADLGSSGVLVFDGGLVRPPAEIDLGPFRTLPPHLCWGCLGETILLSLAGATRDFSIGSRLPLHDADNLARLALNHGFAPAPMLWHGAKIEDVDLDRFAAQVRRRAGLRDLSQITIDRVLSAG